MRTECRAEEKEKVGQTGTEDEEGKKRERG